MHFENAFIQPKKMYFTFQTNRFHCAVSNKEEEEEETKHTHTQKQKMLQQL